MAFQEKALSRMGFTGAEGGNTLWFYADPDNDGASAAASDYFPSEWEDVMRHGDLVFFCGGDDVGRLAYVSSDTGDPIELSAASTSSL